MHAPRFSLNQSYVKAVEAAGGIPLLIPQLEDAGALRRIYDMLDGIMLPGGLDIHPRFYGQEPHPALDPTDLGLDFVETTILPWALEEDLPVLLPEVEEYMPKGRSPLAAAEEWVNTTCPKCGGRARRETDVSDTFLDSAWYFLRYPSAGHDEAAFDPELTRRMLPVDLYFGGPEHVARHHLYARFVTRALHDLGLLPFAEPFPRIRLHGFLLKDGAKMSKSRGNVVVPDEYVATVGADTLRMYLLFVAPFEEGGDWSDAGLAGITELQAAVQPSGVERPVANDQQSGARRVGVDARHGEDLAAAGVHHHDGAALGVRGLHGRRQRLLELRAQTGLHLRAGEVVGYADEQSVLVERDRHRAGHPGARRDREHLGDRVPPLVQSGAVEPIRAAGLLLVVHVGPNLPAP